MWTESFGPNVIHFQLKFQKFLRKFRIAIKFLHHYHMNTRVGCILISLKWHACSINWIAIEKCMNFYLESLIEFSPNSKYEKLSLPHFPNDIIA